jgi:hypothetical protein
MSHGRAPFVTETGSTGTAPTNKWDPFFGTPEGYHEDVRADDQLAHETYNLPKAYEGRNKRLEDILDFMIRSEDEFYTRELLPWEYTEDLHITWDVWKFNRTLADVVPEQGISRLVTQENERHTDNLVRRGLAFQLEHGFMTTEKGRRNYALNLQQISDAVHTTCYFGVMHALFAGQNYYKEYRRKFARFVKGPRTLFRHERQMWACLQKDIKGVYIMDAEIKHHMKINGIVPNVLVLPPKAGIYVSMVPPRETEYHLRGQGAHEALTQDRTGIATFRGSKVFEAQSFDVDFQHEFIDLTSRPRMCGEYFVIPGTTAPHNFDQLIKSAVAKVAEKPLASTLMELSRSETPGIEMLLQGVRDDPFIHIYSADKDDYVKITYAEANRAALNQTRDNDQESENLRQKKDELSELHKKFEELGKKAVAAAKTPREKKEVAQNFVVALADTGPRSRFTAGAESFQDIVDRLDRIAVELDGLRTDAARDVGAQIKEADLVIHYRYFLASAQADKQHYDILLLRPFQTYTMHSAILAKGGSDLGSTYHGHHDFQLSDNVAVKTHFGNYTFYSKAVVKRPRNYTIIPDCFAQGYISGEGHSFFQPAGIDGEPGDLGKAIQEGTLGSSDCRQSLIAWKVPRGDGEKLADAIDITGRFAGAHRDYEPDDELHFSGADVLGGLEFIEELDQNRTDDAYLHQVQQVNTVCFRGAQYTNGTFTHTGKGHWGTPYAGVLPVRDGAVMYMDPSKEPKKGDQVV